MACGGNILQVRLFTQSFLRQNGKTNNRRYSISTAELVEVYNSRKKAAAEAVPLSDIHPAGIFANNELCLSNLKAIGFDYDYTLATYTPAVHELLFDLGKTALVNNVKIIVAAQRREIVDQDIMIGDNEYPSEVLDFKFDPTFAVRGLHFDTDKGLLMKIDAFHHIQLGSVYRGLQAVPDDEVKKLYGGIHISMDDMQPFNKTGPMHQLVDLFAVPEISLISLIIEYFNQNNISYDPEYVFYDIRNSLMAIHKSEMLHARIMDCLDLYLQKTDETKGLLQRLKQEGKSLFLVSNSSFSFINAGMKHMLGNDWLDLFDIVIASARKPKFFQAGYRPFRLLDPEKLTNCWGRVTTLEKGKVYQQGNLFQLMQMTGWFGPHVLYFGDHVYSDLGDPSLRYGLRTGAIIPELEKEIKVQNRPDYKAAVRWLVALQQLIEEMQCHLSADTRPVIDGWLAERDKLRLFTKSVNNPYFGSLFRTHHNTTYFFQRLASCADIYTSSLTNILHYPSNYIFYPHRLVLPHEPSPHQTS